MNYTKELLIRETTFSEEDFYLINKCRRAHNRLGFAYQLSFVRLYNYFPGQKPLKIDRSLLEYVSLQLGITISNIDLYDTRQKTVSEHQHQIRMYLNLHLFTDAPIQSIKVFIFQQACQLEQTHALLSSVRGYLRQQYILEPATSTLQKLVQQQRHRARTLIFERIYLLLSSKDQEQLDTLLEVNKDTYSILYTLKQATTRASANSILTIVEKLNIIKTTGALKVDLSWLNNNLQRWMNHYIRKASVFRIRELQEKKRYALMVCFLQQHYRDLTDDLVRTYDKVMHQMYSKTELELSRYNRNQRKSVRTSLITLDVLTDLILDETIDDGVLRAAIFEKVSKNTLRNRQHQLKDWLSGKYKDIFTLFTKTRFTYLRRFAPQLLEELLIEQEDAKDDDLIQAVGILRQLNKAGKRTLEQLPPINFITPSIQKLLVDQNGKINKPAWECALLTAMIDHIKSGNIAIKNSKRYGHIEDFFMPVEEWETYRSAFFKRSGLPLNPNKVVAFLTQKLNQAFDDFLEKLPQNTYAQLDEKGWKVSKDQTIELTQEQEAQLKKIKRYLAKHMRVIKLPQLLIEVDNELRFTPLFMSPAQQKNPSVEDIRTIIATIMAHGCNIGTHTIAQLIEGVSYHRINDLSNWFLTEENQRNALAILVNAISDLDITKHWGAGKTSSSDGQRFSWRQKVLQQSYSLKFRDFALEFYTFIADNYAPFFSTPKECSERDAPYVLDGLLYNESDLEIEEHFTDTHGYTEINFAAFAMLGKQFSPRIKGIQKQHIYRIDKNKDYGELTVLVGSSKKTIRMNWIVEQWDRMGHFYASLETGYVTASTALKRLNAYTGKNHFYRANKELGKIYKTIRILKYMSDRQTRSDSTRGLLKNEQLHQLARDLKYAKRGRIGTRDWLEQKNTSSCLTLILACIIYWQSKEIHRVILECPPEEELDTTLLKHISPITWDNVVLYGEYLIDDRWIIL